MEKGERETEGVSERGSQRKRQRGGWIKEGKDKMGKAPL